ncbi:MAG: galactose-1-phosphate uridylyltransferase [Halanaerobiaceae bacterium]
MSEMRWNLLRQDWVITATHRQERTFKPPADYCPLCPAEEGGFPTEVDEKDYDLVVFENKFPSLQRKPPEPAVEGSDFYPVRPAEGICEVVLFTSEHDCVMSEKPVSRFYKLVKVWRDRYRELGEKEYVDYVFIFENKGEEVGVTLEHPHGQIYAYPFIPPKIATELEASQQHLESEGECLFCSLLREEKQDGRRIVLENDSFTAFVPFAARYTYEINIYASRHLPSLNDFSEKEELDLACILKKVLQKYDNLFGFVFPYIMAIHQQPAVAGSGDYSHFHIEFYPPYRTAEKLKYLAGSEAGAGTFINGSLPEDKAEEMRRVEIE